MVVRKKKFGIPFVKRGDPKLQSIFVWFMSTSRPKREYLLNETRCRQTEKVFFQLRKVRYLTYWLKPTI